MGTEVPTPINRVASDARPEDGERACRSMYIALPSVTRKSKTDPEATRIPHACPNPLFPIGSHFLIVILFQTGTRRMGDRQIRETSTSDYVSDEPFPIAEAVDNPPPFKPKLGGWQRAPWHLFGDVREWQPEFKALAAALDRGRALGEWNLAFAHLHAGTRRNLACGRAEQYNDFAELLEELGVEEFEKRDSFKVRGDAGNDGGLSETARALCVSTLREKLAGGESEHFAQILQVTFRRKPVAEKQKRRDDGEIGVGKRSDGTEELMDPPTPVETLAATKVLRGCWVHAPGSCAAAGDAGACDALTAALEPSAHPPPPPRDSPSDLLQRALEQWCVDDGVDSREGSKRGGSSFQGVDGSGVIGIRTGETLKTDIHKPPLKIAFPEGNDVDGVAPEVLSIGWDVGDPRKQFSQPSVETVRCEILEALLSLMAHDFKSRLVFLNRKGVETVAGYLLPWLAEGGEESPGELVQRCIVFLGVLIKHVLPTPVVGDDGTIIGADLARQAEATLYATIGEETALEILEAAEDLHEVTFGDDERGVDNDYQSWEEEEDGYETTHNPEALLENAMRAGGVAPDSQTIQAMRDEIYRDAGV